MGNKNKSSDKHYKLDEIYVEKISPLVRQISDICDEHEVPYVMLFQTEHSDVEGIRSTGGILGRQVSARMVLAAIAGTNDDINNEEEAQIFVGAGLDAIEESRSHAKFASTVLGLMKEKVH